MYNGPVLKKGTVKGKKHMRIAICDDNKIERELLFKILSHYFSDTSIHCEYTLYEKAMNLYYDISEGSAYDIIFLDMYLPDEPLGIQIADMLRKNNFNGKIFFCTASTEHALESYDVFAAGYIVKPITFEKIKTVLDRYIGEFSKEYYVIKQKAKEVYIPLNDIMYFESDNTRCNINCIGNKQYTIYKQLRLVESELDGRFLRCHQSYIVNMNHIEAADDVFVLKNGKEILIRQKEKKSMHQKLATFLQTEAED